jgi:hypothetical protein
MEKSTIPSCLTAAHGHSGTLGHGLTRWPRPGGLSPAHAGGAGWVHEQYVVDVQPDAVLNGAAEVKWWQGPHLNHPHGSSYKQEHQNLDEVAGERVLTGEAVGAVATDGVKGGNSF